METGRHRMRGARQLEIVGYFRDPEQSVGELGHQLQFLRVVPGLTQPRSGNASNTLHSKGLRGLSANFPCAATEVQSDPDQVYCEVRFNLDRSQARSNSQRMGCWADRVSSETQFHMDGMVGLVC